MIDPVLARRVRFIAFDVDGVLTDGGVYMGAVDGRPAEFKRFDIQDGLGVRLLRMAGLPVALVSGRESPATVWRARELAVDEVVQDDAARKLPALEAMLARRGLGFADCAFVGDDFPDLPVLTRVGLPIAVANAVPEVKAVAAWVTTAAGGSAAVREVAETLLKARGDWEQVFHTYLAERGDVARRTTGSR